jgi:uncharacterized membrane-anchored protein
MMNEPRDRNSESAIGNLFAPKSVSAWRFWIPMLFQALLILSVPLPAIYIHRTGRVVRLATEPMDPAEMVAARSPTVSYQISHLEMLDRLPGWERLPGTSLCTQRSSSGSRECENEVQFLSAGIGVYVILQAAEGEPAAGSPKVWEPVGLSRDRPTNLPPDQIAIAARSTGTSLKYGVERFYLSPPLRQHLSELARSVPPPETEESEEPNLQELVVEVKVDEKGNALPVGVWLGDRYYPF